MRTNVYIDGFNLFYGCLKGSPHKWLDIEALSRTLLPPGQHTIKRVRYFTARISARPADLQGPVKQQAYLRALETLPTVSVHLGRFQRRPTRMPLANPLGPPPAPQTVEVIKTEEKGSDVNLATYLLVDAFRDDADTFVVISNDSDLMEPMRIVRSELNKQVGILNPHPQASRALQRCQPNFTKTIRAGVLATCQLPDPILDKNGRTIAKPADW